MKEYSEEEIARQGSRAIWREEKRGR